uniref:Uncharacterized protein n=1 Tax=Steinernema glaseri TaxID=37863 RepID=A0A1I7ZX53_9BILA
MPCHERVPVSLGDTLSRTIANAKLNLGTAAFLLPPPSRLIIRAGTAFPAFYATKLARNPEGLSCSDYVCTRRHSLVPALVCPKRTDLSGDGVAAPAKDFQFCVCNFIGEYTGPKVDPKLLE